MKCPLCDCEIKTYRHNFNLGLKIGLIAIYKKKRAKLKDLKLEINEHNNFQKLRYWGLVEKVKENGVFKSEWQITDLGIAFIENGFFIPKWIETTKREITGQASEFVAFLDGIEWNYKKREDYIQDGLIQ